MKLIKYSISDQTQKLATYPMANISLPDRHQDSDTIWYLTVEDIKPEYNPKTQYLSSTETLTDNIHPKYPHLLINQKSWVVENFPTENIINELNDSLGIWLDEEYPVWKRIKHMNRLITLNTISNLSEAEVNEKNYIEALQNWEQSCRNVRDIREQEFLTNGTFPLLTWDNQPTKSDYNL